MRYHLLLLGILPLGLAAQWQPMAVPTTDNLFSIDNFDAQRLAIGAPSNWLRSTDGGTSWTVLPLLDGQGVPLIGSTFFGMEHRSATELLGVGLSLANTNPFEVRRTTNGTNWSAAYQSNGDGFLSSLNALAFNGANGVAVGDLGRIARSTNGGAGWSAANNTGEVLHDVAWCTTSTVVAVGEGRILRSTNAGQTWTNVHTTSSTLYAVYFVNATTGYAAGTGGDLLTTTNGGATWQPLGATLHPDVTFFRDLWFTSATEAYGLCGERIVHSTDGGLHWGWYDAGAEMRQLCFSSPTTGFAVGFGGTALRTGGTGDYHPWAVIDGPGTACHDSTVTFVSESGPGLDHQWFVNGVLAGTGNALQWTFTDPQQNATVTLVVDNGTWTDTTARTLFVSADLSQPINATIGSTTVCSGNGTSVQVQGSQSGRVYRLYRGSTPQGNAQNGNGNTLTFTTGTITAPTTFHLVGTLNASPCGTAVDTVTFNVVLGNPDPTLPVSPATIAVCQGDVVPITVANAQAGVSYQLRRNNVSVGAPQTGTGADLLFTVGPLQVGGTYTVFGTNTLTGCTGTLSGTVQVTVQIPQLAWGPTSMNPQVGVPVDLMNSSNTFGGTYEWTIPGGTPGSSTEQEVAGVTFSTPGLAAVQLIGTTPQGCTDTLVQVLHVLPTLTAADCGVAQWSINGFNPGDAAITLDDEGNMYAYQLLDGTTDQAVFSGAGDTLFIDPPYELDYEHHGHLVKFDTHGVAQWWVDLWHNSNWADNSDLVVDEAGNLYAAYFHGEYLDSLRIVDASGARTTINPPHNGSQRSAVVASFTPNGRLRWMNTFLGGNSTEDVNLELDGQGHLTVQITNNLVQYDRDSGAQLWTRFLSFGFRDHTVLPNDHILVTERFDLVMREYDNAGTLLNTTPAYVPTPPANGLTRLNGWECASDPAGGIYQLHNLQGGIVINDDTLYMNGNVGPDDHYALYLVTKRNTAGDVEWLRTFTMNSTLLVQGLVVNDERVMVSVAFFYSDTLHVQGLSPLPFSAGDTWVLSWALDGSNPQASRIYAHTGTTNGLYLNGPNAIDLSPAGDRIALWAPFREPLVVGSDAAFNYTGYEVPLPQGSRNNGLVYGAWDCVLGGVPSTNAPVAFFEPPAGYCTTEEVPFADASLFGATAWLWAFPGGVPATSTEQDPVVNYTLPGTYSVTLTATNANGTSVPFTADVLVDVCTGIAPGMLPGWSAWPLPATDVLRVQGPAAADARLLDLQGRCVWSGRFAAQASLDVSGLAEGWYTLVVGNARLRVLVVR